MTGRKPVFYSLATVRHAVTLRLLLALLIGHAVATAAQPAEPGASRLVFGVFPFFAANRMEDIYGPVTRHLEQWLRRYSEQLAQRAYDLAFVNPFEYLRALDEYGYRPLARPPESIATWFLARPDGPLGSLADLRGKIVAMAPPSSANSLLGLHALKAAGLTPGRDVTCILPPPLFVAHQRVAEPDRRRITAALVGLADSPEGHAVLARTAFSGFIQTDGHEDDVVRRYRRLVEER